MHGGFTTIRCEGGESGAGGDRVCKSVHMFWACKLPVFIRSQCVPLAYSDTGGHPPGSLADMIGSCVLGVAVLVVLLCCV